MPNCPFCAKYFRTKAETVKHIEKRHPEALDGELNAEQLLYQSTHGTIHGKCMCGCGRDTEWNYKTGKPYKLSPDPECKKRIAAIANARNKRIYGREKVIDDPELQAKMLQHRKISGKYTFKDGGQVGYVGKLEKNFLQFCDKIMELESRSILDTPEVFYYDDPTTNKKRFYMPDFYLPDYNLIVEIKPGGAHPNNNPAYIEETKYKEALKDAAMAKQKKYNFIKIVDKQYGAFVEILYAIVHGTHAEDPLEDGSVVIIQESATNQEFNEDFITENFNDCYVVVGRDDITGITKFVALSESLIPAKLYVGTGNGVKETSIYDPMFEDVDISYYRYIGESANANAIMNEAVAISQSSEDPVLNESARVFNRNILSILDNVGVHYDFGDGLSNTNTPLRDFVNCTELVTEGVMELG